MNSQKNAAPGGKGEKGEKRDKKWDAQNRTSTPADTTDCDGGRKGGHRG